MPKLTGKIRCFIVVIICTGHFNVYGQFVDPGTQPYYHIKKGKIIKNREAGKKTGIEEIKIVPKDVYQDDMELVWYTPENTPGIVGRYEKLELGIKFGQPVNRKIRQHRYDPYGLNPYNPDDIDVYATFWYWDENDWAEVKRINGFHYVDFFRTSTRWMSKKLQEHNFRIRFAPGRTGKYKCKIVAVIKGVGMLENEAFTFDCVSSENDGFVNVGDHKRYLRVGEKPYFPVGHNLTGPNTPQLTIEWRDKPASPDMYDNFYGLMTALKDNGANYFRYIVSPWQSEIEFEKLGDYGDRMSYAWEFDKLLDTAKTLGLKLHYNMAMHYSFEAPSGFAMTFWDWTANGDSLSPYLPKDSPCFRPNDRGYCYRNELNLENPLDFLTDSLAISFYKKRLRYMVARWGYSTEIGIMELLSEANNFGSEGLIEYDIVNGKAGCRGVTDTLGVTAHPYKETPEVIIPDLMAWQIEMCRYIKEDLGHTDHPMAVNYTGGPDLENGDSTYYSEYIDVASFNSYFLAIDKTEKTYNTVTGFYHNQNEPGQYLNKPVMNSEYGANAGVYTCDQNAGFIRRVCLTPFTGTATSAMTWDSHLNEQDVWQYLGPVKSLFEGVPLDAENWTAQEPMVQKDLSADVFSLRKEERGENSKIIGAISNRTFNYWTQGDTVNCIEPSKKPVAAYAQAIDFRFEDLSKNRLKFKNMGSRKAYKIEWYNAVSGDYIETTTQNSTAFGRLAIAFPGVLTGNGDSPILFFKLYPAGQVFVEK